MEHEAFSFFCTGCERYLGRVLLRMGSKITIGGLVKVLCADCNRAQSFRINGELGTMIEAENVTEVGNRRPGRYSDKGKLTAKGKGRLREQFRKQS